MYLLIKVFRGKIVNNLLLFINESWEIVVFSKNKKYIRFMWCLEGNFVNKLKIIILNKIYYK